MATAGYMERNLAVDGVPYLVENSQYATGFLAVYDNNNLSFVKKMGGPNSYDYAYSAAFSPEKDVYVVGRAGDWANYPIVDQLRAGDTDGRAAAYLAKVSSTGVAQWFKVFDGNDYSSEIGQAVIVAENGDVTASGTFEGDYVKIDGHTFHAPSLPFVYDSRVQPSNYAFSTQRNNIFVATFDKNGTYKWGKAFGSNTKTVEGSTGLDVGADGTVYHTGYVTGPTDFGNGLISTLGTYTYYQAPDGSSRPIPNTDAYKGYMMSLDQNGQLNWVHVYH